ncbi:hypothetical protein RCH11_003272 [Glaciihabitans sp. GrIS 2.15]|nr:hypothetical protein [Glaciihabitans sp. GrIS 2.15]
MPKKHPQEVRDRSVRMVLDCLLNYSSVSAACRGLAPKLKGLPLTPARAIKLGARQEIGDCASNGNSGAAA